MTPVRNTPSKVPAPPIEATGAPRLRRAAEIEQIRANQHAEAAADIGERARRNRRDRTSATNAASSGGAMVGTEIPTPGIGVAIRWTMKATIGDRDRRPAARGDSGRADRKTA